jgi:hypothetical protein
MARKVLSSLKGILGEAPGPRETPNNTSTAVGVGGCGIILDAGAAENGLRR